MALELVLQILLEGNNWSSHKASIFDHHRHPGDIFFPVIYHFLGFSQVLQVGKTIGFFQVCCVQSNQSYGTNLREDLLIISTWGENFTWTDNALLPHPDPQSNVNVHLLGTESLWFQEDLCEIFWERYYLWGSHKTSEAPVLLSSQKYPNLRLRGCL